MIICLSYCFVFVGLIMIPKLQRFYQGYLLKATRRKSAHDNTEHQSLLDNKYLKRIPLLLLEFQCRTKN